MFTLCLFYFPQEHLTTVTDERNCLLQELKAIQEEQQALQKETLNIRLKLEQIDGHIAEHQSKIKFWQKEVRDSKQLVILKWLGC